MTVPQVNTHKIKTRLDTQVYHNVATYIEASKRSFNPDENSRYGDVKGLWSIDGHIVIIDSMSAGKTDAGFLRIYRVIGDTYPLRQQFYDAGWRWSPVLNAYEITIESKSRWSNMDDVTMLDRAKQVSPFQSELAFQWYGVYLEADKSIGAFGSWWADRALDVDVYFGQGTLQHDYRQWLFINQSNMFTDESKSLMDYIKSFIGRDGASLTHPFRDLEA